MNHQTHHTDDHALENKGVISAILSALSWLFTLSNFQTIASLVLTIFSIVYVSWNLYDKWKASRQPPPAPDVGGYQPTDKLNTSNPPNPLKTDEKTN